MWWIVAVAVAVLPVVVVVAALAGRGSAPGSRYPPGTRAFESEMALTVIANMLPARETALLSATDPDTRARLERDIAALVEQKAQHEAVVASGDRSPGTNSVSIHLPD